MIIQSDEIRQAAADAAHLLAESKDDQTWSATYRGSLHSICDTTERAAQLAEANGLTAFATMLRRADHMNGAKA